MYYTPLVKPIHGLILAFSPVGLGEAVRDKPAQYISMGARVTVRVVPNNNGGTTVPPNT